MRHDGSPRPPVPGSYWAALLACLALIALLLLCWPQIAHGSDSSPPSATPSAPDLRQSLEMAQQLVQRLTERRQQLEALRSDLRQVRLELETLQALSAELDRQLQEARAALETLQQAWTETSRSLDASRRDFVQLSTDWEAYRSDAEAQIDEARSQRDGWRLGAVVAGICAAVLAVVAALK